MSLKKTGFYSHLWCRCNLLAIAFLLFSTVSSSSFGQDSKKFVYYSEYGAVGDGVADDFDAIVKTHAEANKSGRKVRADVGATYYIGGANKTARIETDTDWGDAKFIIDDTKVEDRRSHVFLVASSLPSSRITTVEKLAKNQKKIDVSLPYDSYVSVTDSKTKRFIRSGGDANKGGSQSDVFLVDKKGNVDMRAPIIWDFDQITSMTAYPIDAETLTVRGGHFTTIANRSEPPYSYYARGVSIIRSNTLIDGLRHEMRDELEHSAPYSGILSISNCAGVTVQNCRLSGHKYYSIGTYDITVTRAIDVTFKNCSQYNDINDRKYWGIFGSNLSKNITFDTVEFSRFDAHMGVAGATIRNSVLGRQGINLIGTGVCLIENTTVRAGSFLNLRRDYGSTFDGELIIRNCEFIPNNGAKSDTVLINGGNSGEHDYGYSCTMPWKVTIDGLIIHDVNPVPNYKGPKIFASINAKHRDETYVQRYPYAITRELEIRNLTVKSGKPWIISDNPFLFRNVKVAEKFPASSKP